MADPIVSLYRPIKKRRVFEEVATQVRSRIIEEALRPGDELPSERELAQQLGVGRPAVREALRALENSGIVELRKGMKGGAFVRELDTEGVSTTMRDLVQLGRVSLNELIETRVLLFDLVIPLVCDRATEDDLQALEQNVETTEGATSLSLRMEATRQFYALLGNATRNQLIMTLLGSLTEVVLDFIGRASGKPLEDAEIGRRTLVGHLRSRNVSAALAESRKLAESVHRFLR